MRTVGRPGRTTARPIIKVRTHKRVSVSVGTLAGHSTSCFGSNVPTTTKCYRPAPQSDTTFSTSVPVQLTNGPKRP